MSFEASKTSYYLRGPYFEEGGALGTAPNLPSDGSAKATLWATADMKSEGSITSKHRTKGFTEQQDTTGTYCLHCDIQMASWQI